MSIAEKIEVESAKKGMQLLALEHKVASLDFKASTSKFVCPSKRCGVHLGPDWRVHMFKKHKKTSEYVPSDVVWVSDNR